MRGEQSPLDGRGEDTISTNDVPGYNPVNNDKLGNGTWAEHEDKSLIFVKSTEDDRVIYEIYDLAQNPPVYYVDAMAVGAFKKTYSYDPNDLKKDRWTWHDKTPFPWDRVIKSGVNDGLHYTTADSLISAAQRIVRHRELHTSHAVDTPTLEAMVDKIEDKGVARAVLKRLQERLNKKFKGK